MTTQVFSFGSEEHTIHSIDGELVLWFVLDTKTLEYELLEEA